MNWLSKVFRRSKSEDPEHEYSVEDTGSEIIVTHLGKEVSRMAWLDILNISILITDKGPGLPDVFWRFRSIDGELIYPQMARGEKAVSEKAMSLPNFDSTIFISAMSSAENQEFLVCKNEKGA